MCSFTNKSYILQLYTNIYNYYLQVLKELKRRFTNKSYKDFLNENLFMCLHLLRISRLLLSKFLCWLSRMQSFSVRHKSQVLMPPLYGWPCFRIVHFKLNGMFCSLSSQTFLDNSVLSLCDSCLKELVCALYLLLNVCSVSPIYWNWEFSVCNVAS